MNPELAPVNIEAEQSLLGALLIDGTAFVRIAARLKPEDFARPAHVRIYRAARDLYERRQAIDLVTVVAELDRDGVLDDVGGLAYLTELIENTPSVVHLETYGGIVERKAIQRRLIDATGQMAKLAYEDESESMEETIDQIEAVLFQAVDNRQQRDLVSLKDLLDAYYEKIEAIQAGREDMLGTQMGFYDLDRMVGGLQPSDLVIVAGRPGMGKTSWLLSVAANIASARGNFGTVALFSLEMSAEQLVQRLIASQTGIPANRLRMGDIRDDEIELVMRAIGELSQAPLYIDDTPGITPFELRTKVRRLNAERRVDLVIVDYLQLMQSGRQNENRVQEISFISRALKGLAREVRMPVIAASQLSRAVEARADKRPQLSDLRESGCLTADTWIARADTGTWVTLGALFDEGARDVPVWTLNARQELEPGTMTHVFASGRKPVFELRMLSGRTVSASANHPFLTEDGWQPLETLEVGDLIAAVGQAEEPSASVWSSDLAGMGADVAGQMLANVNESVLAGAGQLVRAGVDLQTISATGLREMVDVDSLNLATSQLFWDAPHVFWDEIVDIVPLGEALVFDATVPGTHNFVANGLIAHNSIEQDADIVMFLYRDETYHENSEKKGLAEVIVAKHRHGPTGSIELVFLPHETRFADLASDPQRAAVEAGTGPAGW